LYEGTEIITITKKDNEKIPLLLITKNNENYLKYKDIFKKYGVDENRVFDKLKLNES
jgi:hypothetical protein